jgi:HNH endonuclease
MSAILPLTNGEYTLIDGEDYEELAQLTWQRLSSGYVAHAVELDGRTVHFLLHLMVFGAPDGVLVDHRNGDKLDNRKENLREATPRQNCQNRAPVGGRRYKGIFPFRGRWKARIKLDGQNIYLGIFELEEEAAYAYDCAARRLFGEFARLNFP